MAPRSRRFGLPEVPPELLFDFFDSTGEVTGWTSIGRRPNKGYTGHTTGIVRNDSVYVLQDYGRLLETDAVQVGGLAYECVEPFREWRIRLLDTIHRFGRDDPALATLDAGDFPLEDVPLVPVTLELDWTAVQAPLYYGRSEDKDEVFASHLWDEHYEHFGTVTGSLVLGDEELTVDGYGFQDRSWGIRNWVTPTHWEWAAVEFDDETSIVYTDLGDDRGTHLEGYLTLASTPRQIETLELKRTGHDTAFTIVDDSGR